MVQTGCPSAICMSTIYWEHNTVFFPKLLQCAMFAGLLVWVISRCEHSLGPPLRSYCPSNAEAWDKLLDPGLDKSSGISAFSPGLLLLVLWLFFFFLEAGRKR